MIYKLPTSKKIAYGIGNFGYGTVSQTMGSFIMFFGTSVIGISGTLVGIAISIGKFWDAVTDPLAGYLSDNVNTSMFGKRQGFMLSSCLILALFNILIWNIPADYSNITKFVWLLTSLLLFESADTFFATPYTALGYELTSDTHECTKVQAYKTFFFLLGMIMPSLLMMIFMPARIGVLSQTTQSPYIKIGYITSFVFIICCIITSFSVKSNFSYGGKKNKIGNVFGLFFSVLKDKNYKIIIIGYSLSMIATAFLTSIGMHVFTYSFHFSSFQLSMLMISLFAGSILSQFFVIKISKKIGKKETLVKSLQFSIFVISLIALCFIFREFTTSKTTFTIMIFLIFLCGFGAGALYSLPSSIFSDLVRTENEKNNQNNTATLSGIMTFSYKFSNAFALLFIGILLDIIKFNPAQPLQALKVQNSLGYILIFSIAICFTFAVSAFNKYEQKKEL